MRRKCKSCKHFAQVYSIYRRRSPCCWSWRSSVLAFMMPRMMARGCEGCQGLCKKVAKKDAKDLPQWEDRFFLLEFKPSTPSHYNWVSTSFSLHIHWFIQLLITRCRCRHCRRYPHQRRSPIYRRFLVSGAKWSTATRGMQCGDRERDCLRGCAAKTMWSSSVTTTPGT